MGHWRFRQEQGDDLERKRYDLGAKDKKIGARGKDKTKS
jgi:hypothetical protein